jgi:hypothetical protein
MHVTVSSRVCRLPGTADATLGFGRKASSPIGPPTPRLASPHVIAFVAERSRGAGAGGHSFVAIALARCGAVSDAKAITSVMLDFRAKGVFRVMLAEIRRA